MCVWRTFTSYVKGVFIGFWRHSDIGNREVLSCHGRLNDNNKLKKLTDGAKIRLKNSLRKKAEKVSSGL